MKLSTNTINILKNFSQICQGIVIFPGGELKTKNESESIFAVAKVEETFGKEFAIYDLSEFLSVMSLFTEPELHFEEKFLTISDEKAVASYFYGEKLAIKHPNQNDRIPKRNTCIKFNWSSEDFQKMMKTCAVMKLDHISIQKEGIKGYIHANNNPIQNSVPESHGYFMNIANVEYSQDVNVPIVFDVEMLKLLPNDYVVEICELQPNMYVGFFTSSDESLTYTITLSAG